MRTEEVTHDHDYVPSYSIPEDSAPHRGRYKEDQRNKSSKDDQYDGEMKGYTDDKTSLRVKHSEQKQLTQ